MKKKWRSILLVAAIVLSSSYALAEDVAGADSVVEENTLKVASESEDNAVSTDEESEQGRENNSTIELPLEDANGESEDSTDITEDPTDSIVDPTDSTGVGTTNQVILTLGSTTAIVNGESYKLTVPPKAVDGRTVLPLRFVVDQILGADVTWDAETKTVTVQKEGTEVIVQVGSNVGSVDGMPLELEVPPIVEDGTTMLPVRFMSEVFGLEIQYNGETKKIIVTGQDNRPNEKPIANFYFKQSSYTAGQTVAVNDTSSDPDGDAIVERVWTVSGDATATGSNLSSIFSKPKAGTYVISLQVKDKRGLWSEWATQTLEVLPNEAPVITFLEPLKTSYAQGEDIKFSYQATNESWEEIVNEKWTYKNVNDAKALIGKPKAFFTAGEYIVTLELDDAYGNRSAVYETRVKVTDEVLKSELMYKFTEGSIGEIIDNFEGINYREEYEQVFPEVIKEVPGTMIMSDSPEVVKRDGILYRDTIDGQGRIMFHHINGYDAGNYSGDNRRLVLIADNPTDEPITVTIKKKTVKGPATDVLAIGQKLLYDFFKSEQVETITLKPGERQYIYDSKAVKWTNGQCLSGMMDIETTGPVIFSSLSVQHGVTLEQMYEMELLPKDVHPRGTFNATEIQYKLTLDPSKPTKLLIGTGTDDWLNGRDAITLEEVQNRGNFGITYRITITASEDTGIILNPRATSFKGAIKWDGDSNQVYNIPEIGTISGTTTKAAVLGIIKKGETKTFEYMLPNGSAAPVLIGFIPSSYWNN